MANLYLQTLEDCKAAARSLQVMGSEPQNFQNEGELVSGWVLTRLFHHNQEWDDGDWGVTTKNAVIDVDGNLWIYDAYNGYEEDHKPQRIDRKSLTRATGEMLREYDFADGYFQKIRGAIENLI